MMPFVLVSDPRITSLPVTDCGDPLVDVRGYREIIIAGKRASANPGYSLVRIGNAGKAAGGSPEPAT